MSLHEEFEHIRIPLRDVEVATKNFTTIIGTGGYGVVYRGELSLSGNITSVAVKRLPKVNHFGQGFKEFLTELRMLSRYKHPNLISLLGYCDEGVEKLLIYEYADHGSLDRYLGKPCPLAWMKRINICIDVARGLDYLHNHAQVNHRVIHRDIKSANILLDLNWKARIGDLGFSKTAPREGFFLCTMGTPGYCDPEYIMTGVSTYKSDVYSFGVLLFEVLFGRSWLNKSSPLLRAHRGHEEGNLIEIMDLELKDSESVKEFSKIAYQCSQMDPKQRPSMDLVLQKLEKALELHKLEEESGLQAPMETMEFQNQGEVSELEGFMVLPASLPSQAFGVHNSQQRLNELPSQEQMRPGQRSSINELEPENVQGDEKLMSLTDFCNGNEISNQDGSISSEFDVSGQPPSVGVLVTANPSYPSNVGDLYAGDNAPSLSDIVARPQPSQIGGSLTRKEAENWFDKI